jgi:hypothetical protein
MRGRTPGGALGTDILTGGAFESISRYRRFFRIRISWAPIQAWRKGLDGVEEVRMGILWDFSIKEWRDEEIGRRGGEVLGPSTDNLEKSDF